MTRYATQGEFRLYLASEWRCAICHEPFVASDEMLLHHAYFEYEPKGQGHTRWMTRWMADVTMPVHPRCVHRGWEKSGKGPASRIQARWGEEPPR